MISKHTLCLFWLLMAFKFFLAFRILVIFVDPLCNMSEDLWQVCEVFCLLCRVLLWENVISSLDLRSTSLLCLGLHWDSLRTWGFSVFEQQSYYIYRLLHDGVLNTMKPQSSNELLAWIGLSKFLLMMHGLYIKSCWFLYELFSAFSPNLFFVPNRIFVVVLLFFVCSEIGVHLKLSL